MTFFAAGQQIATSFRANAAKKCSFFGDRQAATLVCIAAAVELMCEPLALIFQHRLLIDVRGTTLIWNILLRVCHYE